MNALDAAVLAYSNVSALRQQVEPSHRIHGVLKGSEEWVCNSQPFQICRIFLILTLFIPQTSHSREGQFDLRHSGTNEWGSRGAQAANGKLLQGSSGGHLSFTCTLYFSSLTWSSDRHRVHCDYQVDHGLQGHSNQFGPWKRVPLLYGGGARYKDTRSRSSRFRRLCAFISDFLLADSLTSRRSFTG